MYAFCASVSEYTYMLCLVLMTYSVYDVLAFFSEYVCKYHREQ